MTTIPNFQTARTAIQTIRRRLEEISTAMVKNPGLVRIAVDVQGDQIAFWNNGSSVEYNLSKAKRLYDDISKAYPDAVRTRSGQNFRIELPLTR